MKIGREKIDEARVVSSDDQVLASLGEIAGARIKGQRLEPRRYHPFPARMPLPLAEHLITSLTDTDAQILDPMAGSGTTLIAAKRLGRPAIGVDLDPLSQLVARTETRSYRREHLEDARKRIGKYARRAFKSGEFCLPELRGQLPEEDQSFLKYWFPHRSQKQLFALASAVRREQDSVQRDFAWVVLSSLVIAKSLGASYALDISRSRPHKKTDKPVALPFDLWNRRFETALNRHAFIDNDGAGTDVQVQAGDARRLALCESSVDLVLTSPPYLNAIDYMRAHKFSLLWMGHSLEDLREVRGNMIGTERGLHTLDGLPEELELRLANRVPEDRRRARLRKYLSDLARSIQEIERVLRPGGLAILVVGPTIVNSSRADSPGLIQLLATATGLRQVGHVARTINSQRRSLPPPSAVTDGGLMGDRMRREILVALRKPAGG